MAEGIPYFTLDCQFDDKLQEIEDDFGVKGLGIMVKLLQMIYGIHGYYCEWNDRVASRFARREAFVGIDVVREIVSAALRETQGHEPFFDKGMYDKYGILTSRGIQKRYLKAAKSMKRKDIFPIPEYVLIPYDFSEKEDVSENYCENSQKNGENSSLNKGKVNKIKLNRGEEERSAPPTSPSPNNGRDDLVNRFGEENVAAYEQRYHDWQNRKGISGGNIYQTISRWLEQDSVTKPPKSSIDPEDIIRELREQYTQDGGAGV